MSKWELFHRTLEVLYFLSGIAVAVLASFGLRQVRLAKQTIVQNGEIAKVAARREAFRLSSDLVSQFTRELIPIINKAWRTLRDAQLDEHLDKFNVVVSEDGIKVTAASGFDMKTLMEEITNADPEYSVLYMANALEAFAVPFISGVAAEEVAFHSVGSTYCFTCTRYAPFIVPLAGAKHYKSLLELFQLWQIRLDQEELRRKRAEIDSQLSKAEVKISPIGT